MVEGITNEYFLYTIGLSIVAIVSSICIKLLIKDGRGITIHDFLDFGVELSVASVIIAGHT